MKRLLPLCLATTGLAGLILLMFAPAAPVLPNNPLAAFGVGLIGLGLIRRFQQAATLEAA
ncbi:MAG: holin [Planctomycetota bacterium]